MKRGLLLGAIAVLAATAVGGAAARNGGGGNPGITDVSVSPTLTVGNVTTTTCTGADGTYRAQRFTATGAEGLAGAARTRC